MPCISCIVGTKPLVSNLYVPVQVGTEELHPTFLAMSPVTSPHLMLRCHRTAHHSQSTFLHVSGSSMSWPETLCWFPEPITFPFLASQPLLCIPCHLSPYLLFPSLPPTPSFQEVNTNFFWRRGTLR